MMIISMKKNAVIFYIKIVTLMIIGVLINNTKVCGNDSELEDLVICEDSINYYFSLLVKETIDENKIKYNDQILYYFNEALKKSESFSYSFSSLKNVGIITSDDNKLRIITWNLPYSDRTHKYFGFIQYKDSKKSYNFYTLNDKSENIKNAEYAILNNKNWYGALYYKIIVNKSKGNTYYTLLGADLNTLLTKKKIIEIFFINNDGLPVFGAKVFKNKKTPITRVIFEFNAQTSMTLTFDQEKEIIIYDHLSPSRPSLEGQFEFYGTDFSYDGLKFERGIWNFYEDIDVRDYNID
ncbi:MAG: hypothetical protein GQ564_19070 [Bacteroidales bacterium]|nr:hypothetical protein [Bacteroidales bacterium]